MSACPVFLPYLNQQRGGHHIRNVFGSQDGFCNVGLPTSLHGTWCSNRDLFCTAILWLPSIQQSVDSCSFRPCMLWLQQSLTCRPTHERESNGAHKGIHLCGVPLQAACRARLPLCLQLLLVLSCEEITHLHGTALSLLQLLTPPNTLSTLPTCTRHTFRGTDVTLLILPLSGTCYILP